MTETTSPVTFHLRIGWWLLLLFVCLGVALEMLHGFKVSWYLDMPNETRRLMWRLAHAHGTLLSLVNIAFAASIHFQPNWQGGRRTIASRCLLGASLLIPLGFFLGGIDIYAGDPGLGIVLVPAGAFLMAISVLLTAIGMSAKP